MATETSAEINPDNDYDMVFVWDIEYITMLHQIFAVWGKLSRHFPLRIISPLFGLVDKVSYTVGLSALETGYILDNIQDVVRKEDDNSIDLEKTAELYPKYEALRRLYKDISDGFEKNGPSVNHELIEKCGMGERKEDVCKAASIYQGLFNEDWKYARRCMRLVNKRSKKSGKKYANVVIGGLGIARSAAELLVAGLSSEVEIENIYLWDTESEESSTFTRVRKRFGEQCPLIAVTSCPNICADAKKKNIPIWPADKVDSLRSLYKVQRDFLLRDNVDFIDALFETLNA